MAEIGVGLVGYKFMGRAHSNAYRQLPRFFDVDPVPRMAAICGRDEAGVREALAHSRSDPELHNLAPDLDLASFCAP